MKFLISILVALATLGLSGTSVAVEKWPEGWIFQSSSEPYYDADIHLWEMQSIFNVSDEDEISTLRLMTMKKRDSYHLTYIAAESCGKVRLPENSLSKKVLRPPEHLCIKPVESDAGALAVRQAFADMLTTRNVDFGRPNIDWDNGRLTLIDSEGEELAVFILAEKLM